MALTLAQRFGSSVTLDFTTPATPKLVIELSDLEDAVNGGDIANSQGIDDVSLITALTKDNYADKIASALLVLWKQQQPATNDDATVGIYIDDPFKSFTTRNGIEQLNYSYTVNVYTPDPTASLDPDDVV